MVEKPSKVVSRWTGKGVLVIIAGGIALFAGINVPIAGLVLIGVAAIAGGIVILGFARGMPSVTMPGAMIRAMLAAYRRTLQKTMAQARSMEQVVEDAGLDWLETPDQAVVWGTALGLQGEIEQVLASAASRTCASSRRWRRRPTSRRGTARRTDRRSRAASPPGAAAASSPAPPSRTSAA